MTRIILQLVLPLVVPFVVYWLYVQMARQKAQAAGVPPDQVRVPEVPWTWLAIMGALLAILTLVGTTLLDGASPGSVYEPPRFEDGRIVPGQMRE